MLMVMLMMMILVVISGLHGHDGYVVMTYSAVIFDCHLHRRCHCHDPFASCLSVLGPDPSP